MPSTHPLPPQLSTKVWEQKELEVPASLHKYPPTLPLGSQKRLVPQSLSVTQAPVGFKKMIDGLGDGGGKIPMVGGGRIKLDGFGERVGGGDPPGFGEQNGMPEGCGGRVAPGVSGLQKPQVMVKVPTPLTLGVGEQRGMPEGIGEGVLEVVGPPEIIGGNCGPKMRLKQTSILKPQALGSGGQQALALVHTGTGLQLAGGS